MKRCTNCILPESYPEITFNDHGVCNHCLSHEKQKKITYLGDKALKEKIEQILKNKMEKKS